MNRRFPKEAQKANKHFKCSASLVIRAIQTEATLSSILATSCSQNGYRPWTEQQMLTRMRGKGPPYSLLVGECKLVPLFWKSIWRLLTNLIMEPYCSAKPLLRTYSEGSTSYYTLTHPCSLLLYSRELRNGTSPDVHQQRHEQWKCGTHTHRGWRIKR